MDLKVILFYNILKTVKIGKHKLLENGVIRVEFERYHGLGNDYLVFDALKNKQILSERQIQLICNRNFGFGSDGVLYGPIFEEEMPRVRIYNPDGSEAEKSGNGVRIFSKYLKDFGYITSNKFKLSTLGGIVDVEYLTADGKLMKVLMGKTSCNSRDIPATGELREIINENMEFNGNLYQVTCVNIGNPHCVILMDQISKELAVELGPYVENSSNFPNRINMQLLKVVDKNNIEIEIYERGAGYTLASGSSSCAAATAAYRMGLVDNKLKVHMPGGELNIEIMEDSSVYMTGSVTRIGTVIASDEFCEELKGLE